MALTPAQVVAYCERALAADPTPHQRVVLEGKLAGALSTLAARGESVPCGRCGTPLTDPKSIAAGHGPTCARQLVVA